LSIIILLIEDRQVTELQFGFKSNLSIADTIFALHTTVEYLNSKDSTVFLAALGTRKAFESVKFDTLLSPCVPV
jgi:hypothetical protein